MPKGQSPKVKGAICNIPIDTDDVVNILLRGADSNGLIMGKLKKKLSYRGSSLFRTSTSGNCTDSFGVLKRKQ